MPVLFPGDPWHSSQKGQNNEGRQIKDCGWHADDRPMKPALQKIKPGNAGLY
jgi:hypothetical protein